MEWPSRAAMASHRLGSRWYQGKVYEWVAPEKPIATWTCSHQHRSEAAARACAKRNLHRQLRRLPNLEDCEGCS